MTNDDDRAVEHGRRGFLSSVAATFVWSLTAPGKRILWLNEAEAPNLTVAAGASRPDSDECQGLLKELLGKKLTKVSAVRAEGNPYYGDDVRELSPSSIHVQQVLIERLGLASDVIRRSRDLRTTSDGVVWSLGGPKNNATTRAILGTGSGSPLLGLLGSGCGALPVMFDIERPSASEAGQEPSARILINGIDQPWSDDCLVLAVLPNPSSPPGSADDWIEIIAARHRAGMMATGPVFSNARLLERMVKKTRGLMAWQILIPVRTTDRITPISLGEEKIFEIEADFAKLHRLLHEVGDPRVYALLASAPLIRPRKVLDRNPGEPGKIDRDSSPSEVTPTADAALSRPGEGALTAAPEQEQQLMSAPEEYITKVCHELTVENRAKLEELLSSKTPIPGEQEVSPGVNLREVMRRAFDDLTDETADGCKRRAQLRARIAAENPGLFLAGR